MSATTTAPALAAVLPDLTPPHNIEAEQALLGSLLLLGQVPPDVAAVVPPAVYYRPGHALVMQAMLRLQAQGTALDLITVRNELERAGELEAVGGVCTLAELEEAVPSSANAAAYARIIADLYARREALAAGIRLATAAAEGGDLAEAAAAADRAVARCAPTASAWTATPVDATEMIAREPVPLQWLVEKVVVRSSVGFIGGLPKLGKSLVALHLLLCVAVGKPFLGRFHTAQGRALYVSVEDSERIIVPRIRAMCRALGAEPEPGRLHVLTRADFRIDDLKCMTWLRECVAESRPDLIVFDVLGRLHSQDQNKAEAMNPLMQRLDELRREYGCAILLVSHYKKPQQGQQSDGGGARLAGTVALFGFSECSLYLDWQKKQRVIRFEAKEFAPHADLALTVGAGDDDTEGAPLSLTAEDVADLATTAAAKGEATRAKVQAALTAAWEAGGKPAGGVTAEEVTKALGKNAPTEKTVHTHLDALGARIVAAGKAHRYRPVGQPDAAQTGAETEAEERAISQYTEEPLEETDPQ